MRRKVWLIILAIAVGNTAIWVGEGLAASAPQAKLTQQVAGSGVTVTATLLKDQAEATAIKVALDTHSLNLDSYQLETIATLRDDSGKIYPVVAVEQASGGGHHRQAVLRFGKVNPEAKMIELIVKDVAGVKERTFHWSTTE
jgi:hypothetical protein